MIAIAYLILGIWVLHKLNFVKTANLGFNVIAILFFCKLIAGLVYAIYFKNTNNGLLADTWNFHQLSIFETNTLLQNPIAFVKDIWENKYQSNPLFTGSNSIFNNLKTTLFVKILAALNVITLKNYYANLVLLNFFFLLGNIALYKLLTKGYEGNKWLLILSVFLIPNFLFWQSGLHKDGLVFSLLCFFIYSLNSLCERGFKAKKYLVALVSFCLIFLIKNYLAILIIVSCLIYLIYSKANANKFFISAFVLIGSIMLFSALGGLNILASKRTEFLQLPSNTLVTAPSLVGNIKSVFQFLPSALSMGFLQPKFWQANNSVALIIGLQQMAVLLVLVVLIFLPKKNKENYAIIAFCLVFGGLLWILNGYIIPFVGAIIRYNSFSLPFLIGGFVSWVSPKFNLVSIFKR